MLTLETIEVLQGDFRLSADITIAAGQITAVIGPSGAGKSTLLGCIAGFVAPRRGRLIWDGADIGDLAPGQRPVSVIFQDNNLFGHFTAWQNVAIGLNPSLRLTVDQRTQVRRALEQVGLGRHGDHKPAALSGGQQSRVALARVLVRRRPLLLLDEPFAALGPGLRAEMLDLVAGLAREIRATMLIVSHDPADARKIATNTVFVHEGRVQQPKKTRDLFASPTGALADYLGQ